MSCKLHNQTDIIKSNVEDFASTPYNLIKPSVSPPYVIWLMLVKIQKQFSKCIQNSRKSTTHILVILLVEFQVLNWKSCWHMLISILIRKADLFEGSHLYPCELDVLSYQVWIRQDSQKYWQSLKNWVIFF